MIRVMVSLHGETGNCVREFTAFLLMFFMIADDYIMLMIMSMIMSMSMLISGMINDHVNSAIFFSNGCPVGIVNHHKKRQTLEIAYPRYEIN